MVWVLGEIWLPYGAKAAMTIEMFDPDIENMNAVATGTQREKLQNWLNTHAGDFSKIIDFSASLEIDGKTVDIPWHSENNEIMFNECTYGNGWVQEN